MNKQDLIAKIVKDTGATKAAAGKMLDSTLDTIGKALKKGDAITFVGFGTFKTSIRKARTARNPRTGRLGSYFVGFLPAVSKKAAKSIRSVIRGWRLHRLSDKGLLDHPACLIPSSVVGLTIMAASIGLPFIPYLTNLIAR